MDPVTVSEFSAWFLVCLTFAVICFDLLVGFRWGADSTISRQMLVVAKQYPILAVGVGVLMGHVFWPQHG